MGLPESSVRGFWIACAGFVVGASDVVASVRRGKRCACARNEVRVEVGLEAALVVDGARKSRYKSRDVATEAPSLYALEDCKTMLRGLTDGLAVAVLAMRKQDAHMLDGGAIIAMLTVKFR